MIIHLKILLDVAIMLNKDNAQDTNLLNNEWAVCKTPLIM